MKSIYRTLGWVMVVGLVFAASASAKPGYGTISGVVLDPSGTPQMGASVWLMSEELGGRIVAQILSNQYGAFSTDHLKPGAYAVRVSVAGFLPATAAHVEVISISRRSCACKSRPFSLRLTLFAASLTLPPIRMIGDGCCVLQPPLAQSCNGTIRPALRAPRTRGAPSFGMHRTLVAWCR